MSENKAKLCDRNLPLTSINKPDEEVKASTILCKFGKFHILVLAVLCSGSFFNGLSTLSFVFYNIIPKHKCWQKEFNTTVMNNESLEIFSPQTNSYDFTTVLSRDNIGTMQSSVSNATSDTCFCSNGWDYDNLMGNTVVSEFDLICDSAWKRPLTLSSLMFGMFHGSIFGGRLSDRFGRKRTAIIGYMLLTSFEFFASFSPFYIFYIILVFLIGCITGMIYNVPFVWSQELVYSAKSRSFAAFCFNSLFSLGGMTASLVAYWSPDWKWIYRSVGFIGLVCFPSLCFIPESPTWLLQKGRTQDACAILKKIAAMNKIATENKSVVFDISKIAKTKDGTKVSSEENSSSVLFKNRVLRRRLLITCFVWVVAFFAYYTMALNTANVGGNVYINNLVGNGVDIGSNVLLILLLEKFSRRNILAAFLSAFALFSLLTPILRQIDENAGVAFAQSGRLFSTASMWLTILFTGEMFPTLLRNTSIGIASMSSRIGSMVMPFFIFAGEEVDSSIPFYILSGFSILGSFLVMLLPDTSKSPLPETLENVLDLEDGNW